MLRGTPPTLDVQRDPVVRGIGCSLAERTDEGRIEVACTPDPSWRRDGIRLATRTTELTAEGVDG